MSEHFNIRKLLSSRASERGYHVASERHVRVEFRNMAVGDSVEHFRYQGDLVLTCYNGRFTVNDGVMSYDLDEMDQLVIGAGSLIAIECTHTGTIQMIWSPSFAPTSKD